MNRRKTGYRGLINIPTYYQDRSATSTDYFQISEFPLRLTAGKNLFKLRGNDSNLVDDMIINLEVLDYNGDPIYSEILNYIDEDNSSVVVIYIYEDTSPGDCTITLLAEAELINGNEVPNEWVGRPNVKWTKTVPVNPNSTNISEIIFETTPTVIIDELIGVQLNRTYTNGQYLTYNTGTVEYITLNDTPAILITNGQLTSDMVGGTITVASPISPKPVTDTTAPIVPYVSTIKKIMSPTSAILDASYLITGSDIIGTHEYTFFANSSFTIEYEASPTYVPTQNSHSFAYIQIQNLSPASGDIDRVKVFMNNPGTISDWELINDIQLTETEIFVPSTESLFPDKSIGIFSSQTIINTYWEAQALTGTNILTPPTLTSISSSLTNAMAISSSINLTDINTVLIAKTKQEYAGIFIGNSTYKITLDAIGTKTGSASPILSIYMSGSSFYEDPTDYFNQIFPNTLGKKIGDIQPTSDNQIFNDYVISFDAEETGTGQLLLVVESGNWQVGDISITSDNETGYTPNYTRIKSFVPTTHKSNNQISFKVEYYNAIGEKSKHISYINNLPWEGGNAYIAGDFSMLTGSLYVGDALASGIEIAGTTNAAYMRSLGYAGFDIGAPGFMMWSGSALAQYPAMTADGLPYSGVGLELYADNDSYFRFSTSAGVLDVATKQFTLGSSSQYISGSNGNIEISSSKFHLKNTGDVIMQGTITATAGNIGGFTINTSSLSSANFFISGAATGNQFFISASKFNVKASGDVTGSNVLFTGGKIAGFTISNNTLSNGTNFFISGSATGNGFFISSSKFNVKANGDVTGSSVLFTGGKIGSFTLTNNALSGINNVGATTFFISSSVDNTSPDGVAFFVSASKFNIRQDGTVSGSKVLFDGGKIGGFTIDSSKITGTNIVIDSAGSIQTSDYASDLKGWKISAMDNGYAEFENARIRGTLKTAVFEKETVNAVGGQLYVANSSTITGSEATTSIPQIAYLKFGGYSGSTAIQNIIGSTNTYLTLDSLTTASIKNLPASTQTFKPIGGTGLLIASGSKAIASVANTSVASLSGTPSTALSNYTVMAWVRPDFSSYTASKPSGSIIEKSGSTSLNGPFFLGFNVESVNTASFIYSSNNNVASATVQFPTIGTNALRTNTWTHVALVGNTTGPFVRTPYINGVSGASATLGGPNAPAINTSPINLGVGQTYSERFPGYIADVRVYNVAMTAGEIAAIYSGSYFTSSIAVNTPSLQIDNVTGFVNGEILSAKKISNTGFATEYFQVRDTMRLLPSSETDFSGILYVTRSYGNGLAGDSGSLGNSPSAAQSYEPAQVIVSTGKQDTGFIRINANPNDQATPYIDIVERTGSGIYDVALKARLGDLSGLANSSYVFGNSDPGFGLATDNVFLQGGIIANTGSIGGINMESNKLFTGTGTHNDNNTGFYLDASSNFSLGNKLSWDGSTLNVTGQIEVSNGSFVPGSSIYQHGPLTYWPKSTGTPPADLLPNASWNAAADNAIEYVMGPYGTQELAITCYPDAVSGPDGGFDGNLIPIDSGSAYMFVVYMKRTTDSTSGIAYFGLRGYDSSNGAAGPRTNAVTPTTNTNPYFMYGDVTPAGEAAADSLDRWMLHVGYVYPSGSAYNSAATNVVYDLTTGLTASYFHNSLSSMQPTYTWNTGTTQARIRAYHYSNPSGDGNTKYQEIARPGIFKMDGTEPTIQSLLSNTSTGGSTKIDGASITTGKIRSNNFSTTLGSELNLNAGTIILGGSDDPKFKVDANGDVTGSSVLFTGGKIAGFTISNNTLSNGTNFFISGSATGNGFFISSSNFNVKASGDITASNALFSGNVTAVNFSKKLVTVTNANSGAYFQTISAGPPREINLIFNGSYGGEKTMVMEIACSTNPSLNINDIIVSNTGSGLMPQVEVIINQTNVTFDNEIIKTFIPEVLAFPPP